MKSLFKIFIAITIFSVHAYAEPAKPASKNCDKLSTEVGGQQQQACFAEEQREQRAYNYQKNIYDLQEQAVVRDSAQKADRDKKAAAAAAATGSASGGYADASEKNKKGSGIYQMASMAAGAAGGYFLMQAMACQPPCVAMPLYIKAAVAFGIMGIAMSQSNRMDQSGHAACQAASQTSASQVSCGAAPVSDLGNPYDPSNPNNMLSSLDANGKCLPTAAADCASKMSEAANMAGLKITDLKGVSKFASSDKIKIDANGMVTLPDGKKMPMSELMTQAGMMKAGLSAKDSAAMMKQFGTDALAKTIDAKKDLKELNTSASAATFGGADGGSSVSLPSDANSKNGNKIGEQDLTKDRKPAAAGLTKDFNGESIGASGDDIFTMMNRRYRLKNDQDTFIGQ